MSRIQSNSRRGFLRTCGTLPLVSWSLETSAHGAAGANRNRCVVLISLDGFPAWLWRDPALPVPTLRRLAREGAVADTMTVVNPSITWINHTTLVTGVSPARHGVLFNGLLVRQGEGQPPKVEPWRDKTELVQVPTLYDVAHAAGLTTAEVDWVAILNAKTINWSFAELPDPNRPIEKEMLASGMLSPEERTGLTDSRRNIAWRDQMWTKAATHLLRTHKPNLLLFHTLTTDSANHTHGPGSVGSLAAYAFADRLVGDVLDALIAADMKERATVVVTTDHGFKRVTKQVYPNVALRKAGLVTVNGLRVARCDAYVMTQGGMAFAYVTSPAQRNEVMPRLRELLGKLEGVASVHDGAEGPKFGMPTPQTNPGMGDLFMFAKDGYAFAAGFLGESPVVDSPNYRGTHGYPASDPELDGIFLAWGAGIKRGARLDRMRNHDVAPTLAHLLGVKLPNVEGRVLTELLT